MKRLAYLTLAATAYALSLASAQAVVTLFSNSNITTGIGNGFSGANTSSLTTPATSYGFTSNGVSLTYSLADDFTLSGASTVSSIIVDAYSTSTYPSPPTSPFTAITVNIWNAQPGTAGAAVLFTSSTLSATAWTGVYRVLSTALTGATRPVMTLSVAFPNVSLGAGTYWASYSVTGIVAPGASGSVFTPPVMNADGTLPVGNSIQSADGVTWAAVTDTGAATAVGVPLTVIGNAVPEPAPAVLIAVAGLATVVVVRRRRRVLV